MPPLVSVIIPCYNQARFLAEAIESVLDQDYPSKEVVVVNDGSPDNARDVAYGFRERIVYIEQENKGLAAARNRGIRAAGGEYLAFLDSDDIYLPHTITRLASYLDQHPDISLVCGDALLFDETGPLGLKSARSGKPRNPANLRWETVGYCPTPSTVMMRRACFEKAPLFEETVKEGGEDWLMWVRLSLDFNMAYLDQPLIRYRLHGLSATANTERLNRGNRQAAAFAAQTPRLSEYPRPFRAKLLIYRFATLWRMGPRQEAALCLVRALMTDPFQASYAVTVIKKGITNAVRRHRERPSCP